MRVAGIDRRLGDRPLPTPGTRGPHPLMTTHRRAPRTLLPFALLLGGLLGAGPFVPHTFAAVEPAAPPPAVPGLAGILGLPLAARLRSAGSTQTQSGADGPVWVRRIYDRRPDQTRRDHDDEPWLELDVTTRP